MFSVIDFFLIFLFSWHALWQKLIQTFSISRTANNFIPRLCQLTLKLTTDKHKFSAHTVFTVTERENHSYDLIKQMSSRSSQRVQDCYFTKAVLQNVLSEGNVVVVCADRRILRSLLKKVTMKRCSKPRRRLDQYALLLGIF